MAVQLHFVGNVIMGRSLDDILQIDPDIYIWGDIHKVIRDNDIVIGNLETTLTSSDRIWPDKEFNNRLDPSYASILREIPFRFLSLANNHILDFQRRGLIDTINTLRTLNISYGGAGLSVESVKKPSIIALSNGVNLHIFSACDHYDHWRAGTSYTDPIQNRTIKGDEGIWIFDTDHPEDLLSTIGQYCRSIDNKDIVITSLHWGVDDTSISKSRKTLSRKLIDIGVRFIHGHGIHHMQSYEIVRNKHDRTCLILYSMGDFINDCQGRSNLKDDDSAIMSVSVDAYGNILYIDHTQIRLQCI